MSELWKPPGLAGQRLLIGGTGSGEVATQRAAVIGRNTETGSNVTIGDVERRSGLYVLGKQGMGKSALLVNLIAQDIQNGHGVFFLDPHGEAIEDLFKRHTFHRDNGEILILDPADEGHSFGINPLSCKDITSIKEREAAYKRVEGIFLRLWEDSFISGVWLQEVFQPTIRIFIECKEYTLAEVPLFLNDPTFRAHLLQKIRYETDSVDFWQNDFAKRQHKSQEEMLQPLRSRLNRILGNRYVKHIIAQQKTTIDFADILAKQHIVLAKLALDISEDAKKFIGTILMSELLHAVMNRPDDNRQQFCIFVDEVQNFVSSEDFATTGK